MIFIGKHLMINIQRNILQEKLTKKKNTQYFESYKKSIWVFVPIKNGESM